MHNGVMRFGFSTFFFFDVSISSAIDTLVSGGIKVIEFMYEGPHALQTDDALIKRMADLAANGIEFSVHAPFLEMNLGSYFEELRQFSKERVKSAVRIASLIKGDPVVIHPGYTLMKKKLKIMDDTARPNFVEDLSEIALFAKELGVRIALENAQMPFFFFYDLKEFSALHVQAASVGVTLDIGHAFLAKQQSGEGDPEGALLDDVTFLGVENLLHVHLHNNSGRTDDHAFLKGAINLERVLKGLYAAGYHEKVIIETSDIAEYGFPAVLEKLREISPAGSIY
jgi:sugar phosphate isomerase/epimerase